jgi:hypothetical protein
VGRLRAMFQGRRGAVLSVSLVVWLLAMFDLVVLPRVATQFLARLPSKHVVGIAVAPDSMLVTSTDTHAPANLWIIRRHGTGAEVVGVRVPPSHVGRAVRNRALSVETRANLRNLGGAPVDVEYWPGAGPTLFVVSSPRRSPSLRLLSLRNERTVLESRVPLPLQRSDRRDFFVARWSGPRPDLFVVDRDVNRRKPPSARPWSIRIYTGESDFKALAFKTSIRRRISKQLSQRDWWLDVGTRRQPEPSLVFITRGGRKTGTDQTEVHVLSGHSEFRRFSLHTGTELPERSGKTQRFVYQSEGRGGAVLMVRIRDGHLRLIPVPLP